jgi:hypothetical protein
MIVGALIFIAGFAVYAAARFNLPSPPFGRMPGDISYNGKNIKIFIPVTSMIIVSALLTLILNVISKF